MNNYNRISRHYDKLAKFVFGNSQINAQKEQICYLRSNSKILIVGGGTGWILEEIYKLHLLGIEVDFVESSKKMVELAKSRKLGNLKVSFWDVPIENFQFRNSYDAILTGFLFDNFNQREAVENFEKLNEKLKQNGLWLFCDFDLTADSGKLWKVWMLKSMYLFFRMIAEVTTTKLVDMKPLFEKSEFELVEERWYYGKLIRATTYKKIL